MNLSTMNFTPELRALQGVMLSADNVNLFSHLTAKGGNEEEIEEVILCLKAFLIKENYANINSLQESKINTTRKFAFYIVLNADLTILESMVEMDGIDSLIWTIPTIPKCLMSELLWKLHMDKFINEIIAYSNPELSIEVAEALTNHMKYMSPMESVDKLKTISAACYKLMCRLNFFFINNNILDSAFSIFQKCLKYFITPPNFQKLQNLKKNELYKHIGDSLCKLLHLFNECLEEFNGIQRFNLNNDIDFYMLTYNEESIQFKDDFKTVNCTKTVLDCLNKCHEAMLDILKELVMSVSVDIFCTWSEFDDKGKSMQQTIGELCYKMRGVLLKIESVMVHPVVEMLQQISCKPVEIEDIINTTNTFDIVQNINNNQEKHLWVQALLNRDDLCQNLTLLETLIANFSFLKRDDNHKLFKKCIEHINNNSGENEHLVKLLAIKNFQYCDIVTRQNIVDDTFNNNYFSDDMMTTDFDVMMIEIFNKLIATSDADFSDILAVFIQSPKNVYKKIFILATENSQQSVIMGEIMKYLKKYSQYYYNTETEPCIIKILKQIVAFELDSEKKQNNFISFVKTMKNNNIILGATLLLLVIMPALHEALLNKKLTNIHIQLKMLSEVFSLNDLLDYRAPMLAMMSQVLEVVRWKIHTFDTLGPSCLELTIDLQQKSMNTYQNCIPDKDCSWLKTKLKNKNPLNMYYYRMLWNPPGKTYFEILTGVPVNDGNDIPKLSFYLSQILPSTILDEWYHLWQSLLSLSNNAKLNIFHSAMVFISSAEKDNRTDVTWACLMHCYRNFILIIKHKYIEEPLTDAQVVTIINNIGISANFLGEDEHTEELQSVLLPLLAYIAERKNEYEINIPAFVESSTSSLSLKYLVEKLFTHENV